MKVDRVITARILSILWAICFVTSVSVRANDTPAQAAARAALEQKLQQLDNPSIQPVPVKPSVTVVEKRGDSATNVTDTVHAMAIIPQSVPAATTQAPAAVTLTARAAPITTEPAAQPAARRPPSTVVAPQLSSPLVKPAPVKAKSTNEIVTLYGTIYRNAKVEKVEADGIYVSYEPAGGGVAISKIYFEDLSDEVQQKFIK